MLFHFGNCHAMQTRKTNCLREAVRVYESKQNVIKNIDLIRSVNQDNM